jgi:hypothetical protein
MPSKTCSRHVGESGSAWWICKIFYTGGWRAAVDAVYKHKGFCRVFASVIHAFYQPVLSGFLPVRASFIPIIPNTYNNNYISKYFVISRGVA